MDFTVTAQRDGDANSFPELSSGESPRSVRLFGALRFLFEEFQSKATRHLPFVYGPEDSTPKSLLVSPLYPQKIKATSQTAPLPPAPDPASQNNARIDGETLHPPPWQSKHGRPLNDCFGSDAAPSRLTPGACARSASSSFTLELLKLRNKKRTADESGKELVCRVGEPDFLLGGRAFASSAPSTAWASSGGREVGSRQFRMARQRGSRKAFPAGKNAGIDESFSSLSASHRWQWTEVGADGQVGQHAPKFSGVIVPSHTDSECPHCKLYTEESRCVSPQSNSPRGEDPHHCSGDGEKNDAQGSKPAASSRSDGKRLRGRALSRARGPERLDGNAPPTAVPDGNPAKAECGSAGKSQSRMPSERRHESQRAKDLIHTAPEIERRQARGIEEPLHFPKVASADFSEAGQKARELNGTPSATASLDLDTAPLGRLPSVPNDVAAILGKISREIPVTRPETCALVNTGDGERYVRTSQSENGLSTPHESAKTYKLRYSKGTALSSPLYGGLTLA